MGHWEHCDVPAGLKKPAAHSISVWLAVTHACPPGHPVLFEVLARPKVPSLQPDTQLVHTVEPDCEYGASRGHVKHDPAALTGLYRPGEHG